MLLSSVFKTFLLREIDASNHTKIKGRPIILQDEEALNCIFKVLRTGMQWREIQSSVSYATVFRRFQQWTNKDIFRKAYKKALLTYKRLVPTKYYCIDSSYIKNRFGQRCVGKNHTDRGRKAIKLSIVTDQNGVTYSASTLPGNQPDVTSLSSSLIHMLSSWHLCHRYDQASVKIGIPGHWDRPRKAQSYRGGGLGTPDNQACPIHVKGTEQAYADATPRR
jgi:hypothetical protein